MSIQEITTQELRTMDGQEGLIIQGCGGDLREWVDGIHEILTQEGILKKGTGFQGVYSFTHRGLTCLLFPFKEDMELNVGKLALWRLQTHASFGGTWLSDYVPNRLGGFLPKQVQSPAEQTRVKPDCPLIGEDGNIFNLMGKAGQTLRANGLGDHADEMFQRIQQCQSYHSALAIIGEYVNITDANPSRDMDLEMQ